MCKEKVEVVVVVVVVVVVWQIEAHLCVLFYYQ